MAVIQPQPYISEQEYLECELLTDHCQSQHFYLDEDVHFQSIDLTVKVSEIHDRVKNEDMQQWLAKQAEIAQAELGIGQ